MSINHDEISNKYHLWKSILERDDVNPDSILCELLDEVKVLRSNSLGSESRLALVNTYLPIYTRYLLDKRYYHYQSPGYSKILQFFCEVTGFCLENLSKELFGCFECLMKILDYDKNFYDRHYSPVSYYTEKELKSEFEEKIKKKDEFYFVNHSKSLSVLFNLYINFFGNSQGFQVLSEYIKLAGIEQITQILYRIIVLDDVMPTIVWKNAAISLYKQSVNTVSAYSEELKNIQKIDLRNFFLTLEKLLDKLYNSEKMGKILENLELEISFKMLGTGILEKRIYGVTEIVNKIKNLPKNIPYSVGYSYDYRDTNKWLTSERLLAWLDSHELVSVILGAGSHIEIIKRSSEIIKFMYSNSRFSQDQLVNLWDTAFSKHEAESEALLSLVQDLISVLDVDDLTLLYDKLVELPYSLIDSQILQLAKSFARLGNCLRPILKKSKSLTDIKEKIKPDSQDCTIEKEIPVHIPPVLPTNEEVLKQIGKHGQGEYIKTLVSRVSPLPTGKGEDSKQDDSEDSEDSICSFKDNTTDNKNEELNNEKFKFPDLPPILPIIPQESKPIVAPLTLPQPNPPRFVPPNLPLTTNPPEAPQADQKFDSSKVLLFIWDLWQEPALSKGLNKDIAIQAMSILKDSLFNYFRSERQKFLVKCIENMKNSSFVIWSCEMIKSILESFPSVRAQFDTLDSKSSVIRNLEQDFHLTKILYKSLILFKKTAVEKALQISGDESTSSSDEENLVLVKSRTYEELFREIFVSKEVDVDYIEEFKTRLEFLKYIYSNSNESLTDWHVKILWDTFVLNATSEQESEVLFKWFGDCTNSWPNRLMASDELQFFIFSELLLKIHSSSYTQAAFLCFERFFININKCNGLISQCCSDQHLEIFNIELIAIDTLWEIILNCSSEPVFFLSSCLLKRIYKGLKSCTQSIQEDFIKTCMEHIESVSRVLVLDDKSAVKISRCLELLMDFIDDFEVRRENYCIRVKMIPMFGGEYKECTVSIDKNAKIEELKENIFKKLGLEKGVLAVKGRKIGKADYCQTVEEVGVEDNEVVIVNEGDEEETDFAGGPPPIEVESSLKSLKAIFEHLSEDLLRLALEKCDNQIDDTVFFLTSEGNIEQLSSLIPQKPVKTPSVQFHLSSILSNTQSYFSQLFDLFSFGSHKINTKLWHLLSKLSTNHQIYSEIKFLNSTEDWNILFDSHCTFKLLYSLQIADEILIQDSNENWKSKFFELGGLNHILHILLDYKILGLEPNGPFDSKVLDYLLSILSTYLVPSTNFAALSPDKLIHCVVQIIQDSLSCSQSSETLIPCALQFLSQVLEFQPSLLQKIYDSRLFDKLLSDVLLNCSQKPIRFAICSVVESIKSLESIPAELEHPSKYFWNILFTQFPENDNEYCEEFFYLALRFIDNFTEIETGFIEKCINFVLCRNTFEDRHKGNQDKVLTGYLQILGKLLLMFPGFKNKELLCQIYSFLFDLEIKDEIPPKFKHHLTRQSAFEVIQVLCLDNNENSEVLLEKLYLHHTKQKTTVAVEEAYPTYAAKIDMEIKPRALAGYVGLRNFGSTCYLNSLMQQIFMMEDIRNGILKASLKSDLGLGDNVLFQVQNLLANLLESEKEYFDPFGFCQAFKGYDGEAINVRVQQDADEFLNLLFDKLEELMKGTESSDLLRDHIGGSYIHEIVSTESEFPYYSSRDEHFFRLSLDVKNKKSIQEALDLFIKDDILEGDNKYYCEKYDTKVTAKTRCLIKTLANTVIIHLKRFEFDYTSMQRFKINDYCEFPMGINLKPWAKEESKDKDYYEYELAGVLLHSGGADSGHYTSIIKDRKSGKWFRFDDRYVEVYSLENLKNDCFGGETTYNWGPNYQTFAQTKNAYMLIYERKYPIQVKDAEAQTENTFSFTSQIFHRIRAENLNFLKDLLYFDKGYFSLLASFISNYNFQPCLEYSESWSDTKDTKELLAITKYIQEDETRAQMSREELQSLESVKNLLLAVEQEMEIEDSSFKLIKLGTLYAYETLTRSKNFENFKYWIRILQGYYLKHIKAAIWFLNYLIQNREIVSEILVECRDWETRSEFSKFISSILQFCAQSEEGILLNKVRVVNLQDLPYFEYSRYGNYSLYSVKPRAVSARFIELYIKDLLQEFKKNSRRVEDYLQIISDFAACGSAQKVLLIESDCLNELIAILGDHDFYSYSEEIEGIFKLLSGLLLFCRTCGIRSTENYPWNFKYPGIDLDSLTENRFTDFTVKRNLIQNIKLLEVEEIVCHLCWENVKVSNEFLEDLAGNLLGNKFESSKVLIYLKGITKLLLLNDQVKRNRVQEFLLNTSVRHIYSMPSRMTFFEQVHKSKDSYCGFTMNIIAWWGDLMEHDHILEVTKALKNQFKWIPDESYYRVIHYNFPDYFNRGAKFEADFEKAVKKFKDELDNDSESSEVDVNQYQEEEIKEDGEENSTESENYY